MNIIFIILMILACVMATYFNNYEHFDETNTIFQPLGQPRYGLRGERLSTRAIDDCYYDRYKCYTNTFINNPVTRRYYDKIYSC